MQVEDIGRATGALRRGALTGPPLTLPDESLLTIPALLAHVARERAGRVALRAKRRGIYRETTWAALRAQVTRIGLGLMALGVARRDRVAIVGDPSPEWLLADFAAQSIGAISFGLYPTSSRDEAEFVLRHGGASVLIAEDQEHVDKVLPMLGRLPDLRKLVVIDDSNMFGYRDAALMSLGELMRLGDTRDEQEFLARGRDVHPDDGATIVYTSGTSAHPKGALYTHRALITLGTQFHSFVELTGHDVRSVVHLPLNHLYERANTPQGMLVKGIVPHFGDEAERFLETLYEVAPQHHASVPRYWSKLASRVIVGIENSTPVKRAAYGAAMKVGRAYRRRRWSGERAPALGALYGLARLAVFNRMLKKLGLHRVRLALSSGAPLPAEVQALWQVWGVNLKNLYGQTESGVVTAQFAAFPQPGSVGQAYPGNEVSLGADDEIICRSPGSFAGYWADEAASAEMRRADGIRTGDVGTVDAHGLKIVDRKKDIVITAGGKNVSPSRIETVLKSSPYVSEASVVGEGRKIPGRADRDRRRYRVGMGARQGRDLFDASFARNQCIGQRTARARDRAGERVARPRRAGEGLPHSRPRARSRDRGRGRDRDSQDQARAAAAAVRSPDRPDVRRRRGTAHRAPTDALGPVDSYLSRSTIAAMVTTAR